MTRERAGGRAPLAGAAGRPGGRRTWAVALGTAVSGEGGRDRWSAVAWGRLAGEGRRAGCCRGGGAREPFLLGETSSGV